MSKPETIQRAGRQTAKAAARTRSKILEAALQHFAQKGFDGASLREIAAEAEATHGLIRHHFGTKEDLWCATVDDFVSKFEERHRPLLSNAEGADPVELLKGFVTHFVRVSAEFPGVAKIIMNDCSQPGPRLDFVVDRMLPIHRAIVPVFLAVQKRGLLPQHDADSFFIFLMMLGAFPFALPGFTNKFYRRKIGSKAGVERHIDLVLQTLFARGATTPR